MSTRKKKKKKKKRKILRLVYAGSNNWKERRELTTWNGSARKNGERKIKLYAQKDVKILTLDIKMYVNKKLIKYVIL